MKSIPNRRQTLCDVCGKPDPSEAIARQQEQMRPRQVSEGYVRIVHRDPFLAISDKHPLPDVRMGDIAYVKLVAGGVEDITAGVYCECDDAS